MSVKNRKQALTGGVVNGDGVAFGTQSFDELIVYAAGAGDVSVEGSPDGSAFYEVVAPVTAVGAKALIRVNSPLPSYCRVVTTASFGIAIELVRRV